MSSFDQWKSLLRVFCFCRSISSHEVFYKKVVSALYFQMETIPADFMVDIVSSSNIVLHCLNEFFRNMYESDGISAEVILEGTLIRQKKLILSRNSFGIWKWLIWFGF